MLLGSGELIDTAKFVHASTQSWVGDNYLKSARYFRCLLKPAKLKVPCAHFSSGVELIKQLMAVERSRERCTTESTTEEIEICLLEIYF